jgi:hypothetical protein
MIDSGESHTLRPLDRINLRLSAEMFRAIDAARSRRAGNVSRNTWIAEAIEEKLAREIEQSHNNDVGQAANA